MRGNALVFFAAVFLLTAAFSGIAAARLADTRPSAGPFQLVADVPRGEAIFQSRCSVCHTVQAGGPNKLGPNLHGLIGRRAGSLPGYSYSAAMRDSGIVWDAQTLDAYLTNPHQDIPGDKMPFSGLPSAADRADVIAYLAAVAR